MKRYSVYLLYGIAILTAVVSYDFYSTVASWRNYYRSSFAERADRLNDEAYVARSYDIARGDDGELAEFLESRRRTGAISFWALYGQAATASGDGLKILNTSIAPNEIENFRFNFSKPGSSVWFDQETHTYYYATEALNNQKTLVVGLRNAESEFLKKEFELQRKALISYLVGLLAICFGIFVFFFRDITSSIRELTKGGARYYGRVVPVSKEAQTLARGLASYDDQRVQLKREKELLTWQVLPSLRTELASGRQPPYSFACTVVRTDINNFSKIYNENPVEEFAETINEFFIDVSHIVARYGGLVHEFVGDEVIFYFKDEAVGNSVATAVSAVRDINEAAARQHKMTMRQRGYPFTVKSSLAEGYLRFGRFVNAYGLAGPALIETVRILAHIHEKDGNVLVFDQRHIERASAVATSEPFAEVKLKGFSETKKLVIYRQHLEIIDLLQQIVDLDSARRVLPQIGLLRSDDDLVAILKWARSRKVDRDSDCLLPLIAQLRRVSVTKAAGGPQRELQLWLDELIQSAISEDSASERCNRVLSSVIRLLENLVPASDFSNIFEMTLRHAMELKDRRIVANAVEVLTLFKREYLPNMTERLSDHTDNRVAANALVHEGLCAISPFVVKRLSKMLEGRNVARIASGLYALGEIAAHQRTLDPVYYMTQTSFIRLTGKCVQFAIHDDARVRRQALVAARKCGNQDILNAIWDLAESRPQLMEDAKNHLDSRSPKVLVA